MSEISREEVIKKLNCHLKHTGYCDCDKCSYSTDISIIDTLNKAISDMEKLDKIETLFEPKAFGEYPSSYEDIAKEIQKIVKAK